MNAAPRPVIAQPIPTPIAATAPGTAPATPPTTAAVQRTDFEPARLVADQVSALARQMTEPTGEQEPRDSAARRLLAIGTAEARNAVQFALRDPGNNTGRLAAARAIGDDAPADPEFIDPLFVLLDAEVPRPLMEAAAIALGNFKSADVAVRLIDLTAANRPEPVRLAAVRALSTQIEKRAAARLVELAQDASAPAVALAAVTSLQTFASLPYDAAADWTMWWRSQGDVNDDRFRLDVLTARATRFEQQARRGEETYQELRRSILTTLAAAPRETKGEVLSRHLTSPREVVRLIAIRQAYEYAATADLPASCRPIVRDLLADVSSDVRYEAARIVQLVNDAEAFASIAQQVAIEPDPRVRAELADALGTIGNVEALPLLRPLLDDPSNLVVQASAGALARLGPSIVVATPNEAAELSIKLQRVLAGRALAVGGQLREAIVEALVPLRQRALLPVFAGMLTADPPESPAIRRLAAQGLGAIGEPDTDSILVDALSDASPAVRLEAVRAIGKVSRSFLNAPRLYALLDPKAEPDATVRNTAWATIREQMPVAPLEQLVAWPDREFLRRDEPKRLEIFTILAQRYATAGKTDEQTSYLQQIGDTQMKLGEAAESTDDRPNATREFTAATQTYRTALALAKQTGPAMREESLTIATVKSLLRAHDYEGASAFARGVTREYQGTVGAEIKSEANRLANEVNALDDALTLINAALAMGSALPDQHRDQLRLIQQSVQRRQGEKNQYAIPDVLRAVCMR